MAEVCTSWRSKCRSDHLWQNHMNKKWRKVIGEDALREWQWYVENFESKCCRSRKGKRRGLVVRLASLVWDSVPWIGRVKESKEYETMKTHSPPPDDSIMYWYLALETGKFHFPAQVYNREVKFAIFTVRVKKKTFLLRILRTHMAITSDIHSRPTTLLSSTFRCLMNAYLLVQKIFKVKNLVRK